MEHLLSRSYMHSANVSCNYLGVSLWCICIIVLYQYMLNEVNSLWPSDIIWQHVSKSTMALVMACCLMAPSHYLNQCWLLICEAMLHLLESNFTASAQVPSNEFEKYAFKISAISLWGQLWWVTSYNYISLCFSMFTPDNVNSNFVMDSTYQGLHAERSWPLIAGWTMLDYQIRDES